MPDTDYQRIESTIRTVPKAYSGKINAKDFVFVYQGGTSNDKPFRRDRVYSEFKRNAKVAGIPTTRSLHGMRHQAVTTWIEKGFHTAEASYMAGHLESKGNREVHSFDCEKTKRKK